MRKEKINYLFLIPTYNEDKIIENTIKNLLKINVNTCFFEIIFLLDNTIDKSVNIIQKYNLNYVEKKDNQIKGKGFALKWFINNYKNIDDFAKIVILDADTIIDKNFLENVYKYQNEKIIQGYINPIFNKNSIISSLSAYSEIISQKVKDTIKTKLNWSVILRGTGMVIDKDIFKTYIPKCKTQIEDTELSILLVRDGYKIKFLPNAIVNDPKPLNINQASNQRARWLYGQYQIIKYYWKGLIKIAFSNLGNFFFVLDIVLKPKTLFYLIKVILLLFFIITNISYKIIFISILTMLISIDILNFLIGGFFIEDKKHYYRTLFLSPIYISIWLISIIKMFLIRGKRWLKAR